MRNALSSFHHPPFAMLIQRLTAPAPLLLAGLLLAAGLALCPARWTATVKGGLGMALRPGQVAACWLSEQGRRGSRLVHRYLATVDRLAELERAHARLAEENRRLASALAAVPARRPSANPEDDAQERLLRARGVKARVLGRAARAFLAEQHVIEVGSQAAIRPEALVLEELPGMLDQGRNVGLQAGHLVLSRGRVWGKVVEVGQQTSTIRRVTEPGYRDLVRLATAAADGTVVRWGPKGILEGTGEPLARIRMVEATEPVAVDDLVYSVAAQGILPEPVLYGRIVRIQRTQGAAHWDLWMEPAAAPGEPQTVIVLRTELNPLRQTGKQAEQDSPH